MARRKNEAGAENLYRRGDVWWVRFTKDGQEIRKSTEQRTLHDARRVRDEIKHAVKAVGSARTFAEMVETYFEREGSAVRFSSADRYRVSAKALLPTFGAVPIHEISRGMIADFIARRRKEEVSDATIRRDLAALHVMLNSAVSWEWLDANPVARVKTRGLKETQRTRFLTEKEWQRLSAKCEPELRAICTIAVEAGLRLGEILSLTWGDIDARRMEISVRDGKTGSRTVPMSEACLAAIKSRGSGRGLVFWKDGPTGPEPLKVIRVSQRFSAVAAKVNLSDVRFHDLRHTFASWKVQQGHDLYRIQRILGHKGPQMTQRYAQLRTEDLHSVVGTKSGTDATQFSRKVPVNTGKVKARRK